MVVINIVQRSGRRLRDVDRIFFIKLLKTCDQMADRSGAKTLREGYIFTIYCISARSGAEIGESNEHYSIIIM